MKRGAVCLWRESRQVSRCIYQKTMKHAMNVLVSFCFHGPPTGAELMKANGIAKWEKNTLMLKPRVSKKKSVGVSYRSYHYSTDGDSE